jgi:phage-related protein
MKWNITYYNSAVSEAIKSWPKSIQGKYLRIADLIAEHGPNHLGRALTKPLGNGLFEIRVKAQDGIGRAFFCYVKNNEIVVLHAFIKKTQKTPKKELKIAKDRMKEVT